MISKNTTKEMYIRWQDENYKQKMLSVLIANANNQNYKQKRKEGCKSKNKDYITPDYCKQISDRLKKEWQDENYRNRRVNAIKTSNKRFKSKETRQKISNKITKLWQDGVYSNCDKSYSYGKQYTYIDRKGTRHYLKSLQELRVAYFLDLCKNDFKYGWNNVQTFKYTDTQNKIHTYLPDFQIKNFFIEVKPNRMAKR